MVQILGNFEMISLDFDRYRRVRIWLADPPDLEYDEIATIERVLAVGATTNIRPMREHSVTMELFMPMSGMAAYACLGIDYVTSPSDQLTIEIAMSNDEGRIVKDLLADKVDEVRVGLPQDYANAVVESLLDEMKASLVPGTIRVQRAAHGIVGSSSRVFGLLTKLIVRLMFHDIESLTENEIKGLINL